MVTFCCTLACSFLVISRLKLAETSSNSLSVSRHTLFQQFGWLPKNELIQLVFLICLSDIFKQANYLIEKVQFMYV